MLSDLAEVAKLSSSSFSSTMSSGIASSRRSVLVSGVASAGTSSERNLRRDSGDMSRDLELPLDDDRTVLSSSITEGIGVEMVSASVSSVSFSLRRDDLLLDRLKSFRGDHGHAGVGDTGRFEEDRERWSGFGTLAAEVPTLLKGIAIGTGGAALGAMNLSAGLSVM